MFFISCQHVYISRRVALTLLVLEVCDPATNLSAVSRSATHHYLSRLVI